MKKLLFIAIAAMCFSCASKKQDEKKQSENVVKKTEAVQEHQCTGDCESHAKAGHTHGEKDHECTGDCASHAKEGHSHNVKEGHTHHEKHQCTGDCKNCPSETCNARKEPYQGKKADKGVEVEEKHACSCGSC